MNQVISCIKCNSIDLHEMGYSMRDLISWQECLKCGTEMVVEYDLVVKDIKEVK